MIASFGDKATSDLYHGLRTKTVRRIPRGIWRIACRKLGMIQWSARRRRASCKENLKMSAATDGGVW